MGIMEDAKAEKQSRRKGKKGARSSNTTFFTFHPTVEQKYALRVWDVELSEVLEGLAAKVESGFKLTLSQKPETGTYLAIMRENGDDWKAARCASYWNVDPTRALMGLYFYLTNVNPSWPEASGSVEEEETDW